MFNEKYENLFYLELDSRIEISPMQVRAILENWPSKDAFKELKHFARKIVVDYFSVSIEVTQGRRDF